MHLKCCTDFQERGPIYRLELICPKPDLKASQKLTSSEGKPQRKVRASVIAATAVFTAFVAVTTMAFTIYIPATKGYFNFGEIMVYIVAMLMGPYVGAFAGGVGSAISDSILAPAFAPGTLVIKGTEGFLVGFLTSRGAATLTRQTWKLISIGIGALLALLVSWIGISFLSGPQQLYFGLSNGPNPLGFGPFVIPANATVGPQYSASFVFPSFLWILIAVAVFALVVAGGLRLDPMVGWTILSFLIGGAAMVAGYFIYESFALQEGFVTASIEVPINIGQVLVGLMVSIAVLRSIRRATKGRALLAAPKSEIRD
jgi:uncharacterized membrane protein